MLVATKANMEYNIQDEDIRTFVKQGFDIYKNGVLVERGTDQTVPVAHLDEILADLEEKKAIIHKYQIENDGNGSLMEEIEALRQENEELKARLELDQDEELVMLREENEELKLTIEGLKNSKKK